ncbi:MAG: hypothetical protein R3223_03395, partial [Longimicrobiales bacterium]|nr:hypothetical protein [Longimicrobiales bacterium]
MRTRATEVLTAGSHPAAAFCRTAFGLMALSVGSLFSPGGPGPLSAQDRPSFDVQLTPAQADYPVGSVFIEGLDSIWTAAGTVIAGGSILIEDGIISEIGTDLEAPDEVEVLDGRGLTAIPGLVDEHSHTAMLAVNEGTGAVVPEVQVLDVLDPEDFDIYRALSGGVTTARIMHGSANPIGGQ